jgi:outer membrane protein assembly factor BamB
MARSCAVIAGMGLLLFAAAAGAAPPAAGTGADLSSYLSWQWDDDAARAIERIHPRFEISTPDGGRVVYVRGARTSRLRRLDARGAVVWSRPVPGWPSNSAAMVIDGDTVYAALYNGAHSGCQAAAFDARTGALRWEAPLEGLGFVAHSMYMNRVQVRLTQHGLAIYGKEWRGRYVELLDPADGRQLGHRVERAGPPASQP